MEYTFDPRITGLLLHWYGENARDLPWRGSRDPYAIWVSEIMLQQTQVETVKPYFARFMAALPTVQALAEAPEGQVLKLWEGLGYYSRARNLHRCAKAVVQGHDGAFPDSWPAIRALPGIGEYTAGAVLSIAFGKAFPAVDGNVLRVAARVLEIGSDMAATAIKRAVSAALEAIYPPEGVDCGHLTQSLMELGATVCIPGENPRCGACPIAALCRARAQGTTGKLPIKTPKKAKREEALTVLILHSEGRIAIRQRPASGLLASLWQLPSAPGHLEREEIPRLLDDWGIEALDVGEGFARTHIFTHVRWDMRCYAVRCAEAAGDGLVWADCHQLEHEYTLPAAFRKCLGE